MREAGGWEDEVGVESKCRNIKEMVDDRRKVWMELKKNMILRYYIRDLKGVREGELELA